MSLCKKYDCSKCQALKDCGGCEACDGFPFHGAECVAAKIVKKSGLECYLKCEKEIIEKVNNLGIEGLKINNLCVMLGAMVNLEYQLPNGEKVKYLKDDHTYFTNQIESPNPGRCYGLVTDGRFVLVAEYKENGSDPELICYRKI